MLRSSTQARMLILRSTPVHCSGTMSNKQHWNDEVMGRANESTHSCASRQESVNSCSTNMRTAPCTFD